MMSEQESAHVYSAPVYTRFVLIQQSEFEWTGRSDFLNFTKRKKGAVTLTAPVGIGVGAPVYQVNRDTICIVRPDVPPVTR